MGRIFWRVTIMMRVMRRRVLGEFSPFVTMDCLLSFMRIESFGAVMVPWFLVLEQASAEVDGFKTVLTASTDLPEVMGMNR
jgi:hypothetical protein